MAGISNYNKQDPSLKRNPFEAFKGIGVMISQNMSGKPTYLVKRLTRRG